MLDSRALIRRDFLESLRVEIIVRLLRPYQDFCHSHDLRLDRIEDPVSWFGKVHWLLNAAPTSPPLPLVSTLSKIQDISSDDNVDYLINTVPLAAEGRDDLSASDYVAQAYLNDPAKFELHYALSTPTKPSKFIAFLGQAPTLVEVNDRERIKCLEQRLGTWFQKRQRSDFCEVHASLRPGLVQWSIIHGQLERQCCVISRDGRHILRFRPEKHDMIQLCLETGGLMIHAKYMHEADFYRALWGDVYLGDPDFFCRASTYSLKPFLTLGKDLFCVKPFKGLLDVRVVKLEMIQPDNPKHIVTHRSPTLNQFMLSSDIQSALRSQRLKSVKLSFVMEKHNKPLSVNIRPPQRVRMEPRPGHELVSHFLQHQGLMSWDQTTKQLQLFDKVSP